MNSKILYSTEFYKFGFHKEIVAQNNLPLQALATSTLRNSIGRRTLATFAYPTVQASCGADYL